MIARLLLAFCITLYSGALLRDGFDRWVSRTILPVVLADTSVEIRDRNGALLRAYTVDDGIWRFATQLEQIDPQYLRMLIAYEDKRFLRHGGVDAVAAARAAGQFVRNGRVVSGGSTLTMQVARLLENSGTGSWRGKLRQVRVALALERKLTKKEILTLYVTHAPFGANLEGVRAASLAWFGKEPKRLTEAQAALLVALPQSPEARRPDRNLQNADTARNRVLKRLERSGILTEETTSAALTEPLPRAKRPFPLSAPHLADRAILTKPERRTHALTIDAPLQSTLEKLAARAVPEHATQMSVAIVVADHETGDILASVGSATYSEDIGGAGFVDMTRAFRSPGSTLKPLVYGLAFDAGLAHPQTLISDQPVRFGQYAPQNFDGHFRGDIRVEEALIQSLNIPVVLLTNEIGPARLHAAIGQAGVQTKLRGKPGLAISLGGIGVSLEGLVQLYAMQARGGKAVPLRWRIEDNVETGVSILSRAAAWQVSHILSDMPPPPNAAFDRIAYKTGTSYGHRDTWAIGFDGEHVIGVWMGRPDGTPIPGAYGGDLAAPVLFEAFQRLKSAPTPLMPPPPETLLLGNAQLPKALQRFRSRQQLVLSPNAPEVTFPPDGARLLQEQDRLTLKLRNGQPPFSVLANSKPMILSSYGRELELSDIGKGASIITVIDALGRSDRVEIWLE
jgi:penicillin-binding protein 1C